MMQAIIINYPASRCPYQVRRINLTGHWLFMQPEHIHNHLRLCLSSRRFYELTEMLGMQPKLLCPRRSRFAPKMQTSFAAHSPLLAELAAQSSKLIAHSMKTRAESLKLMCVGYVKEQSWL